MSRSGMEEPFSHDPTPAGTQGSRRRTSYPETRASAARGGGLLSFARAASNRMRAIITGRHQATRPSRPSAAAETPPALPGEPNPERPRRRYQPYRRSRVRLVIHKRAERRQQRGKKLLIAGIASSAITLIAVIVSIIGGSNVYAFYNDTQKYLNALSDPNGFQLTTRIYDRNGVLLYEMYHAPNNDNPNDAYRFYDHYWQISDWVKKATVDIEDKTFWTNSGIDILGILRAGITNVTSQQIQQGGSTITQQLIKNAFFVDPKTGVAAETATRKVQEALMAYAVTHRYSKQDLLEFYLNIIPYGYLSQGIEAAAQNYFSIKPGIDAKTKQYQTAAQQLTLAQAALLAGLPRNPTGYAPCGGDKDTLEDRRTAALNRMDDVLTAMLKVDDITQQQWNEADAEAHKKDFFHCRKFGDEKAPHFVDYVIDQLALMLNDNPSLDYDAALDHGRDLLAHAGLNVYTTLDYSLEQHVESVVYSQLFTTHTEYDGRRHAPLSNEARLGGYNIHDAAVVVIDPRTGEILAMDGSGDYTNNNHDNYNKGGLTYDPREGGYFNVAAYGYRQPGSSFKPIVYAAAFEMGWFPGLVLKNVRTCFPIVSPSDYGPARKTCDQWYAPINYGDNLKLGSPNVPKPGIRIREALGNSLNIPAVQALYFAGIDNVVNLAERMGIRANPKHNVFDDPAARGPSIALGAAEVRLLDMTNAYAVFANGGYYIPPRAILLVTDAQGNPIPGGDFHNYTKTRVLSEQTCFLITSILTDNNARAAEFGYNNVLYFGNQPYAAAKTGTTDDFKDNLTIGYTPYLAVGVWSGNANDEPLQTSIGITGAAPIWHDVVKWATDHYKYPSSYWPVPPGVNQYLVNAATGLAPYQGQNDGFYSDWYMDNEVPSVS